MLDKKILFTALAAFSLLATGASAELRTTYQYIYYDKDGDGYIDTDEYDIHTYQIDSNQPVPPAHVQTLAPIHPQRSTEAPLQNLTPQAPARTQARPQPEVIAPRDPATAASNDWTHYTARTTLNTDTGVDYRSFDIWDIERDRILQGIPEQAGTTIRQSDARGGSITAETEWLERHGLR